MMTLPGMLDMAALPLARRFLRHELGYPLPSDRMRHEFFQPLQASFILPGADDPPADGFAVGGRLRLKESPGDLIRLQLPIVRFYQVHPSLFVGVDARLVLFSGLIGFEAGRPHPTAFNERLSALNVDAAPDAAGLARREANGVAELVEALANAVDPAKTERFVN